MTQFAEQPGDDAGALASGGMIHATGSRLMRGLWTSHRHVAPWAPVTVDGAARSDPGGQTLARVNVT